MEHLFQYTLAVSVPLTILWIAYRCALANVKHPAGNRLTLLAVYAVSLTLFPLIRSVGGFPTTVYRFSGGSAATDLPASGQGILPTVAAVWAAGAAICIALSMVEFVRIYIIVRLCEPFDYNGRRVYLSGNDRLSPFSFGRIIVMSRRDYEECGETILLHEEGHIKGLHILDLLLSQAVTALCWYNPAAWLMRGELKTVHEYQADAYVLNSGCDAGDYQLILFKKSIGSHFSAVANNLNYSSIRRRISMMNRPAATPRSLWCYTVPLAGLICAAAALTIAPVKETLTPITVKEIPPVAKKPAESKFKVYVNGKPMPYEDLNDIAVSEIRAITVNKKDNHIEVILTNR